MASIAEKFDVQASHYYAGKPGLLALAAQHYIDWMEQRRLHV